MPPRANPIGEGRKARPPHWGRLAPGQAQFKCKRPAPPLPQVLAQSSKVVYGVGRPPKTEDKGTRGGAGGGAEVGVEAMGA